MREVIATLAGPGMQEATLEHAEDVAYKLMGDADPSSSGDGTPSQVPMSDVVTEEEKRLIAADAKAAAKNGFPQVKITPSDEY
eukprot:12895003-Alexandrium_andersonii.AAC.1